MFKKSIIFSILGILLFSSISFARNFTVADTMNDSTGTAISSFALTSGVSVNSERIFVRENAGFAGILVTVDASGDVDIFAEYSTDGINFHRAFLTPDTMDGTITQEGLIVLALTNATRYIIFTPRPARYMRIVFDPDANSTITAEFIYVRDR